MNGERCTITTTRQLTFNNFPIEVIHYPVTTPIKKAKIVSKKQAAAKEPPVNVQDFDCTKNAAMKCCCCIHTNGRSMWFPSCPRTLAIGEVPPKTQDAYGKMSTRMLVEDVKKYSCNRWKLGIKQSCFTCDHHDHTDVLKKSCPLLRGKFRDGKEADALMMNSRKIQCPSWTPKPVEKP